MSRKIAILISFMALVVAIGACGGGLSEEETGALSGGFGGSESSSTSN